MQVLDGRRKSFPLRLSRSVRAEAEQLSNREGISINQFIVLAVAEKIARLEHFLSPRQLPSSPGSLISDVNHITSSKSGL